MRQMRALYRKFRDIPYKSKIVLMARIISRLFGMKTCLFLGGYYQEDDDEQSIQDQKIYLEILESEEKISRSNFDLIETQNHNLIVGKGEEFHDSIKKVKKILNEQNTYIALMVEKLDKGGLEEVVRTLTLEFQKRHLPIKVFCTKSGGEIAEYLLNMGVEVIIFYNNQDKFEKYIKNNRPLLVNTHYVIDFLSVLKHNRIPVIETIHNMYIFLDEKRKQAERDKEIIVNHYIAVSKAAKNSFKCMIKDISDEKITIIGNSVCRTKKAIQAQEEVRYKYSILKETYVYLVVGSIDPRKNQIGIIRAWDIFRRLAKGNVILILAGAVSDDVYGRKIKNIIHSKGLEDSVRVIGYCSDVIELINASDALIIDSYYEGWSVAATEALSCGIPIIHSRCGSGEELVANGQNGVLIDNPLNNLLQYNNVELIDIMHRGINDNVKQLVEAMLYLYENKKIWRQKRTAIRYYANRYFNIDYMIEKYIEVYMEATI